jgi:hypothetical protein
LGLFPIHPVGQRQFWLLTVSSSVPGLAYPICIKTHVICQVLRYRF